MTDSKPIEALLFDLGGVVIAIDFERVFENWATRSALPVEQIRARFAADTLYLRHERGELDAAGYFGHLRRLLLLDASDAEIAAGWNAVFVGQIEPAVDAIRRARAGLPCFCFTNTNPTHQAVWSAEYPALPALFDEIFVSSEIGMRKPERQAFETVARRMGVAPEGILFFDDMRQNIDGARSVGMQGVYVSTPQDIHEALARIGLI